ncbi:MAG TPA: hypothetical protein VFV17_09765 [Usitatibacteraceae bacterium]|nr:hypothetical protein [Usitatibacteraceae bacterium]
MHETPFIQVDRFTRSGETVSGEIDPMDLPRLRQLLAAPGGRIQYRLTGSVRKDRLGGAQKRVKCIIYGWFFLADRVTLEAQRHEVNLESMLVLVGDESELPPLESEPDDEDTIVCGPRLDILERVEEELLLEVPAAGWTGGASGESAPAGRERRESPFAALKALKDKQ